MQEEDGWPSGRRHGSVPVAAGRFCDRADAGWRLADELADRELHDPTILAMPRGGVPVACEISARLGAPLEVFVARKIGAPGYPELGIGAVAEGGSTVVICTLRPDDFRAVGPWSDHFTQTSGDEVLACLQAALHGRGAAPGAKGERW